MWYVLAVIVVFIVTLSLAGSRDAPAAGKDSGGGTAITKTVDRGAARVDIARKLAKLAASKPPTKLSPGAMCYEVMAPPDRAEYVCPDCGEKTLYATKGQDATPDAAAAIAAMQWQLEGCRRLARQIRGLDLTLDESAFCRKCTPAGKNPRLSLVVRYADTAKPHRADGISANDLVLIKEFLAGKDKHKSEADWESPLKKHLPRLQFLLGFEPEQKSD